MQRDPEGYPRFYFGEHPMRRETFLFHYTSDRGLAGILTDGRLRFSTLDRMSDPRESLPFMVNGPGRTLGDPEFPKDPAQWMTRFRSVLKSGVWIASMTTESGMNSPDAEFLRGYSRARNWAQYGGNHYGACLVFELEAFRAAVKKTAGPKALVMLGEVDYTDAQVGSGSDVGRFPIGDEFEPEATARAWRQENLRPLLLRKNEDWASEREFRALVIDESINEFSVPIRQCLAAIVLGYLFEAREAAVLMARLTRTNLDRVRVARMTWHNGAPATTKPGWGLDAGFAGEPEWEYFESHGWPDPA